MSAGRPISSRARWALFSAQLAALAAILIITNPGVVERLGVILTMNERWWLIMPIFLALWAAGLVALAATMLLPNIWARVFWAFVIALSGAIGFGFYLVSETELSIFDVVSLWNARHEAGRALAFYQSSLAGAAAIFVVTLILLVLPPPPLRRFARARRWLVVVPLVPIVLYASVIVYRGGDGSRALPAQFAPISIGALAANKIATNTMPQREDVPWTAGRAQTKHIVLLVDESIRADFIDWRQGNPYTPQIAGHQDRIVNFGPAASGGNCSHYANAILRFGGTRHALTETMLSNATLWRYAKQAGYRTVFIDAQAAFMRNGGYSGKFQNFMSAEEAADIDDFHALNGEAYELDDKLLDVVLKDLRGDQPVFIYAVKNGAHFPYDADYPESAAEFRPTMAERGRDDPQARVNSYRNAIRWNVDRFFARLFSDADLRNSAIIYTSDHGQNLEPKKLTHCSIDKPAPVEGLVPLFAITDDAALKAKFAKAAQDSFGHASHFSIAPTLLQLLGYPRTQVASRYGTSMFEPNRDPAAFTSGDVFGLFSDKVRWHPIDLLSAAAGQARAEAKPHGDKYAR